MVCCSFKDSLDFFVLVLPSILRLGKAILSEFYQRFPQTQHSHYDSSLNTATLFGPTNAHSCSHFHK